MAFGLREVSGAPYCYCCAWTLVAAAAMKLTTSVVAQPSGSRSSSCLHLSRCFDPCLLSATLAAGLVADS